MSVSATQLELYTRAPRRWAFQYLTNLPRPAFTAATSFGTALHKIGETYQETGRLPAKGPELDLFLLGLPYLPPPKSGLAEQRFRREIDGVPFAGAIDFAGRSDVIPGAAAGHSAIIDLKTSSDPAKYGLQGRADFLTKHQPLIYATVALLEAPSDTHVYLRWLYFKTKGRAKVFPVSALLSRRDVDEAFTRISLGPARELVRLRTVKNLDPNDLPCNQDACYDYNSRCPYWDHCKDKRPTAAETGRIVNMAQFDLLAEMEGMETVDTKPEAPKPPDPINRGKRVSARPSTLPPPVAAPEPRDAIVPPAPDAPGKTVGAVFVIVLEELSEAFARAAKRVA